MLILLFVVPLIVFVISLIKYKDCLAVVPTLLTFFIMLGLTAITVNCAKDDIKRVEVVSDINLVELIDNVYVVETWEDKDNVKYQYLRPDAQFNERTYRDKDDIEITYENGAKPHLVEYRREWTSGFAKFVFCSEPKNKEVIYLPDYSNLSVVWDN